MSEGDSPLLPRRVDARAEGQARINAVGGDVNADTVYFGDSIETQRQILVSDIEPNLPPRKLELWVDRAQVQAELLQRLDEPQTKLIEVVALGGFGKSSLAVWATEPAQAKGKRVVPVNFKKVPSFSSFGRWVLQELGFLTQETIPDDELMAQLVYRLKSKRCLVVMDQLEAIAEAKDRETFKTFLAQWQHHGQNSTVLVTTRQRFLPQAELCLQLPGFTATEGAVFLQKKEVSTALADGLPRLSTICNGHPLLLNLSAAWLQETKENILDEDELNFFTKLFKNDLDNPEAQVEEIFAALIGELSETSRLVLLGRASG